MKKILFISALAIGLYSCTKECVTYQVEENGNCTNWAAKVSGTWEIIDHSFNPSAIGQVMTYRELQPNVIIIDESLTATMITANQYEVTQHTVNGPNGPYQYQAEGALLQIPNYGLNIHQDSVIVGYTERLTFVSTSSNLPQPVTIVLKRKP